MAEGLDKQKKRAGRAGSGVLAADSAALERAVPGIKAMIGRNRPEADFVLEMKM